MASVTKRQLLNFFRDLAESEPTPDALLSQLAEGFDERATKGLRASVEFQSRLLEHVLAKGLN